jgi:hypothetical protein
MSVTHAADVLRAFNNAEPEQQQELAQAAVALVKAKIQYKGNPALVAPEKGYWWKGSWTKAELELYKACKDAGLI